MMVGLAGQCWGGWSWWERRWGGAGQCKRWGLKGDTEQHNNLGPYIVSLD